MKLVKSLLLGSAAGLAAVAGAQAADLPVAKAAPVEYVRVCSTYGAGFFYIPGTETCLRVGGRVRADYLYGEPFARAQDAIGFRARGRINIDTRTATAYGLLRAYIRYEITRDPGAPFSVIERHGRHGSGHRSGLHPVRRPHRRSRDVVLLNADLPTDHMGTLRFSDAPDVNVLAYTFSFGNGFSATLSLEDGLERRSTASSTTDAGRALHLWRPARSGRRRQLKYDGTWGTAQLSGALHQVRSDNLVFTRSAQPPRSTRIPSTASPSRPRSA